MRIKRLLRQYVRVRVYGDSEIVFDGTEVSLFEKPASVPAKPRSKRPGSGSRNRRKSSSFSWLKETAREERVVPCFVAECSAPAVWTAQQLFGKRLTMYTCNAHRPLARHSLTPVVTAHELCRRLERARELSPAIGSNRSVRAIQGGRIESKRRRHYTSGIYSGACILFSGGNDPSHSSHWLSQPRSWTLSLSASSISSTLKIDAWPRWVSILWRPASRC